MPKYSITISMNKVKRNNTHSSLFKTAVAHFDTRKKAISMKLIEILTFEPYIQINTVDNEDEAEEIISNLSPWVLLTERQFEVFTDNVSKYITKGGE